MSRQVRRGRRAPKEVTIRLVSRDIIVPGGISILNALATVSSRVLTDGNYCGEGECAHCEIILQNSRGHRKTVLACQSRVEDGQRIVRMSKYLDSDLSS